MKAQEKLTHDLPVMYVRDRQGNPTAVLVAEKCGDDTIYIGWSASRKPDIFNKKRGRRQAVGRVMFGTSKIIPHRIREMLPVFSARCVKFFKVNDVRIAGRLTKDHSADTWTEY
jgi:hypothetical protein